MLDVVSYTWLESEENKVNDSSWHPVSRSSVRPSSKSFMNAILKIKKTSETFKVSLKS